MSYEDDLIDLNRDDPEAAVAVAKNAKKAGELNKGNAEALVMLQSNDKNRNKVNTALEKLLPAPKKEK